MGVALHPLSRPHSLSRTLSGLLLICLRYRLSLLRSATGLPIIATRALSSSIPSGVLYPRVSPDVHPLCNSLHSIKNIAVERKMISYEHKYNNRGDLGDYTKNKVNPFYLPPVNYCCRVNHYPHQPQLGAILSWRPPVHTRWTCGIFISYGKK